VSKTIGMFLLLIGIAGSAMATVAPEIDATSGSSALALLSGSLFLIRSRRRK